MSGARHSGVGTGRIVVLVNRLAGRAAGDRLAAEDVCAAFAAAGAAVEVRWLAPAEVPEAARGALEDGAGTIVAGGGDGTVSTVAGVAAGRDAAVGVLPLGTANHFARDLGIPLDLAAAARVVLAGRRTALDVAEINGRVFINNSLLGLYPEIASLRDRLSGRFPLAKRMAKVIAALAVFPWLPRVHVRVRVGDEQVARTTPFVFIGNNAYEMNFFRFGARDRLSSGRLFLYMSRASGRVGTARLVLRALFDDVRRDGAFDAWNVPELTIETARERLRVFADGELFEMAPPLVYRVRPRALNVVLPAG